MHPPNKVKLFSFNLLLSTLYSIIRNTICITQKRKKTKQNRKPPITRKKLFTSPRKNCKQRQTPHHEKQKNPHRNKDNETKKNKTKKDTHILPKTQINPSFPGRAKNINKNKAAPMRSLASPHTRNESPAKHGMSEKSLGFSLLLRTRGRKGTSSH